MLNIAICDDDIQITGKIERLLQDIAKRNFVDTEIEVFWNGKSLADAIAAGERYDVIYLDIEMDKEDGISAARRIRTYDKNVRIIYVQTEGSVSGRDFRIFYLSYQSGNIIGTIEGLKTCSHAVSECGAVHIRCR